MSEKLEYNLKLLGSFYIDQSLNTTKSVKIIAEADIFSVEKKDLEQDNEFRIVYKGKVVGLPEIEQGDIKVKAKMKSGKSKTWRYLVEKSGEDYEQIMEKMILNSEEVIEFVKNL
jgi:hypothetical protein